MKLTGNGATVNCVRMDDRDLFAQSKIFQRLKVILKMTDAPVLPQQLEPVALGVICSEGEVISLVKVALHLGPYQCDLNDFSKLSVISPISRLVNN